MPAKHIVQCHSFFIPFAKFKLVKMCCYPSLDSPANCSPQFTFRSINKFPTRGRNRNKGILTPAARSKGITRSARSAAAAAAAAATTAGGWNAQSYSTPTPQGPPPVPPTAAIPGSYVGDVNSRSRGVVSERAAIKRPAAALTRASETEPPHQVRR